MAVAAAIGVDSTGPQTVSSSSAMSNRLANKMRAYPQQQVQQQQQQHIGEINRSIEKMSLGAATTTAAATTTITQPQYRRDSDWTNSTEGYGSMRSSNVNTGTNHNSRRCSEVSGMSQCSNFSTRALRNSPWGVNPDSRRSSLATEGQGHGLSQQLSRLHQKAVEHQSTPTPTPHHQSQQPQDDCHSVMSECISVGSAATGVHPPPPYGGGVAGATPSHGTRRASDPVRVLDRNFGARRNSSQHYQQQQPQQQMTRHRSFNQVNQGCERIPLQNVRQVHNLIIYSFQLRILNMPVYL